MATLNPILESPNPIPYGTRGTITLSFTTSPAGPDHAIVVTVTDNGILVGQQTYTLGGTAPEAVPSVAVGNVGAGWEIQSTAGTLVALGDNKFSLSNP